MSPYRRAGLAIGLSMLLLVGGALLGTAPLAGVLSKSPIWFGLAGAAIVAGVVLLIHGFRPIAAAVRGDLENDIGKSAESVGNASASDSSRGPRPARVVGYVFLVLTVPMLVIVASGHGDALSVFNLVLGLVLIVACFVVDRWLSRRYERSDT